MVTHLTPPLLTRVARFWHLLLRGIFNQHIVLPDTPFLSQEKREIAKKKIACQHAFEWRVLCLKRGSPDRESYQQ